MYKCCGSASCGCGSALGKRIRIRIQLLVYVFCEFYSPCWVSFPKFIFPFFKFYNLKLYTYYKSNKKLSKKLVLSPLFWLPLILPGSVFSVTMRIWIRILPNNADPTGSGSTTLMCTYLYFLSRNISIFTLTIKDYQT